MSISRLSWKKNQLMTKYHWYTRSLSRCLNTRVKKTKDLAAKERKTSSRRRMKTTKRSFAMSVEDQGL